MDNLNGIVVDKWRSWRLIIFILSPLAIAIFVLPNYDTCNPYVLRVIWFDTSKSIIQIGSNKNRVLGTLPNNPMAENAEEIADETVFWTNSFISSV